MKYYRLAADQGVAEAQYNLGVMYANGYGVAQDFKMALKYYRLAAEQGHASAQLQVGRYYFLGQGVTKNKISAQMWFIIAATNGNPEAVELRDIVASEMSPSQVQKAQKAASTCMESQYKKCR